LDEVNPYHYFPEELLTYLPSIVRSHARSTVWTRETFATEFRGNPVTSLVKSTLPGKRASRTLLVSGTQTTVETRLRLKTSG
jgi:hypothetical protein